jgi:hypothetical protein
MNRQARCDSCGKLMMPVQTAIPGIAGALTGVLVACRPGQCSVTRRATRALLTAGLAFVLGKIVEAVVQRVCHCRPSTL